MGNFVLRIGELAAGRHIPFWASALETLSVSSLDGQCSHFTETGREHLLHYLWVGLHFFSMKSLTMNSRALSGLGY